MDKELIDRREALISGVSKGKVQLVFDTIDRRAEVRIERRDADKVSVLVLCVIRQVSRVLQFDIDIKGLIGIRHRKNDREIQRDIRRLRSGIDGAVEVIQRTQAEELTRLHIFPRRTGVFEEYYRY